MRGFHFWDTKNLLTGKEYKELSDFCGYPSTMLRIVYKEADRTMDIIK